MNPTIKLLTYPVIFTAIISCNKSDVLTGTTLVEATPSINRLITDHSIIGFDSYGQSLSIGGNGRKDNSVLSTSQPYNAVMFNYGVRTSDYGRTVPTSLVPMVENLSADNTMGETPCSGFAEMFNVSTNNIYQLFGAASGQGAQTVLTLSKGTTYYKRLINNITNAKNLAGNYTFGALCFTQGEADYTQATSYENYRNTLLQMSVDLNNEIPTITGQTSTVPFIVGQCSSQNRTTEGKNNPAVALAQLDLCLTNPNFVLAAPMYMFNYLSDNTHLSDTAYKILGAYYGYAYKMYMIDSLKNFIYPATYTLNDKTVTITFHVPVLPLVFDTVGVVNPGNYGFNARNSNGNTIAINSVQFLDDSTVSIVCAKVPKKITYAINGTTKRAGRVSGPRGCLRDSQGNYLVFEPEILNWKMHNWTPIFSLTF